MTTNDPLIVPVSMHALVVNEKVRKQKNFQRYELVYENLEKFDSPEPKPYANNSNDFNRDPGNQGIYLHWSVPECLRQGDQSNQKSTTEFPRIPNRWLVIRYSGPLTKRIQTAWIVESDFLDPNKGSVSFLNPADPNLQPTKLGRRILLAGDPWVDPDNVTFLTAMGPGNPIFLSYQPDNENVVSIHDELCDVTDGETLSYCVIGWFSKPEDDILASWGRSNDFKTRLKQLSWSLAGDSTLTTHGTIYHSMVNGIVWDENGALPHSSKPAPEDVEVAIGNTQIDALTALIENQEKNAGVSVNAKLLEVFQYDLLGVLDDSNGNIEVEIAMKNAWFGALPGGYCWDIVYVPDMSPAQGGDPIDEEERFKEEKWLSALNVDQKVYDDASRELLALQAELYCVWWKNGNADHLPIYPDGVTPAQFNAELAPDTRGSLANKVRVEIKRIGKLLDKIPHGQTAEDLARAIGKYQVEKGLPESRELRRSALDDFHLPNDPTLLFAGARADQLLVSNDPTVCRAPAQEITGFKYKKDTVINVESMHGRIPLPVMTNMPDALPGLVNEFFLLDVTNATMIALVALNSSDPNVIAEVASAQADPAGLVGIRPDPKVVETKPWITQPWKPLMMMWMVDYYSIPYMDDEHQANWKFDGEEWKWLGENAVATPLTFSGRVFLTPKSAFNMKSLLEKYLANTQMPDLDVAALEDFISKTDEWDFLSQTMDGLGAQILMQSPLSNRAMKPASTLGKLVEGTPFRAPAPGIAKKPRMGDWPPSEYQETRSSQFVFQLLTIVDRFGQTIEKVSGDTADAFRPIRTKNLTPDKTIPILDPDRIVQLQPRLNMPGRLDFNFVSAKDDNKIVGYAADIDPVCAWVLPNHLDMALTFYAPDGEALGEVTVITNDQQEKTVHWFKGPYSNYAAIKDLKDEFKHLFEFLSTLIIKGPDAFNELLRVIDATLWSIDPLGNRDDLNLSVLVGRPLALLRTKLDFALDGPPLKDQSWRFTFKPREPEFPNWQFPVRLGETNNHGDGLLGYFVGSNYDQFFSTHSDLKTLSSAEPSYITPIGPDNYPQLAFNGNSSLFLTILADPRAAVHATTGILPTMKIEVSSDFVDSALSAMDVTFRTGPVLTNPVVEIDGANISTSYRISRPSERHGQWSWLEFDPQEEQWDDYGLAPNDPGAKLTNMPMSLRSGLMRLSRALNVARK